MDFMFNHLPDVVSGIHQNPNSDNDPKSIKQLNGISSLRRRIMTSALEISQT